MKKYWFLSAVLIGFVGILSSCHLTGIHGNGKIVSQERPAKNFNNVILEGVGNVNIYYAENYKVRVTTDSNIQEYVTIKVIGDNLYIDEKSKGGVNPSKLTIDIYTPGLGNIILKGVGNIKIVNGGSSDINLNLSGVGNIDARNYEAENVVVTLSGTGDIKTWVTKSLTGKLSGIGNIMYKGNPSINNVNRTGIGNVKKL